MDPWANHLVATAQTHRGSIRTAPFGDPLLDGPYDGPELLFDLMALTERLRRVKALEARHGCRFFLAVKAIGAPEPMRLFQAHGIGFDVSNYGEWVLARSVGATAERMSLTGPALHTVFDQIGPSALAGLRVNVETAAQYARIPAGAEVEIGLRIDASAGSRRGFSRFGARVDDRAFIDAVARDPRMRGIHMHVSNGREGYPKKVAAALDWLEQTGLCAESINFGGGLEHFDLDALEAIIIGIRKRVGPEVELRFEPGYFWFADVGFARTQVLAVDLDFTDRTHKVTLDISRVCHLQWTSPRPLVEPTASDGMPTPTIFYGPTCLDGDVVTAAALTTDADGGIGLRPGDVIALSGVGGYAAAWNRGFNGLPPARIVYATEDGPDHSATVDAGHEAAGR